jgi:HD-GYP domain-containing protein (c-di-GMP phosphodiesterase class II)
VYTATAVMAARPGRDPRTGSAEATQRANEILEELRRHSPPTRSHSERVRGLADLIGETLGLPDPDREKLQLAALLHDVGKLAVPRRILTKPDDPTDAEWEMLRRHPNAARSILLPLLPWLGDWVGAAVEHHERFDGRGYPCGVAGTEITLAGRIVAVADAYDCMVSARSYKAARSIDRARAELAANSGSQFDPEIVRALLAVAIPRLRRSSS